MFVNYGYYWVKRYTEGTANIPYVKIAMASTDKVEVLGQPPHIRGFYALSVALVSIDQEIIHKK